MLGGGASDIPRAVGSGGAGWLMAGRMRRKFAGLEVSGVAARVHWQGGSPGPGLRGRPGPTGSAESPGREAWKSGGRRIAGRLGWRGGVGVAGVEGPERGRGQNCDWKFR